MEIGKNALLVSLLVLLSGCNNGVYVASYSRVGLDLTPTTGSAGIGYKNATAMYSEPKSNGDAPDVLAVGDMDLHVISGSCINEILATGEAAVEASKQSITGASGQNSLSADDVSSMTSGSTFVQQMIN